MRYVVRTEVEAVLLIEKDQKSISDLAEMLGDIRHFYTPDGVVFPKFNGIANDESTVAKYGNYLVKESYGGISEMSKELFEEVSDKQDDIPYNGIKTDKFTIGTLRSYLNQLPKEVMNKEVWLGDTGVGNKCNSASTLNLKHDKDFHILLEGATP